MADYPHLDPVPAVEPENPWERNIIQLHKSVEGLTELLSKFSEITNARLNLVEDRITNLESDRTPSKSKDEVADQILAFLKQYPGLKFNTGTIAANIGSHSLKISDKLKGMVGRGLIKFEKKDKLSAMFWYEAPEVQPTQMKIGEGE